MRCIIVAVPVGITLLSACATAPRDAAVAAYVDTAEVIQAEPLYRQVQVPRPVSECWIERAPQFHRGRAAYRAPVVGGIVGGVVGNRLASRESRVPMTVAGALLGASIGHNLGAPRYSPSGVVDVRRCRTVNRYEPRRQLVGYRVDYRYEGQTFSTRTPRHPGRFIRVRVGVDPVDGS